MADEQPDRVDELRLEENWEVIRRRYAEARMAGLSVVESQLFADSGQDIGQLRKLVKAGCPVETLRLIVI